MKFTLFDDEIEEHKGENRWLNVRIWALIFLAGWGIAEVVNSLIW